jgi:hypothetical protein
VIRRFSIKLVLFLCAATLFAQGTTTEPKEPLSVEIQFHNQQIYRENDEILVKVTIRNNTAFMQYFRVADIRAHFSLDFTVKNLMNNSMGPSNQYTKVFQDHQSMFTRDVSLNPNEEFSFVEVLGNYTLLPAGTYVVSALFYPQIRKDMSSRIIPSNRLSLTIRPDLGRERNQEQMVMHEVQKVLKAQALPPDQVVDYFLKARIEDIREQYFLYMNVESLYILEPQRKEKYLRLSALERDKELESYKTLLWEGSNIERDTFSVRPVAYRITNTQYDSRIATVSVIQEYTVQQYTYKKLYRYKLEKQEGIWKVMDFTVSNVGAQ